MIIHYKCPNCAGNMSFNAATGTLTCPSCGHQDKVEELPEENIVTEFEEGDAREYHCQNCAAVLITDENTVATSCNFCGSNVVLADRVAGTLAPTKVIPFTITKDEAIKAFKKWSKNGRFTPRGFASKERLQSITGMYVPFWLFDFHSDIYIEASAKKVRTYVSGDYIYTETKVYEADRQLKLRYLKIPADASIKMDDELMDKLEPYIYGEMEDFNTAYLAGFIAEKYNLTDEQLKPRALNRIDQFINQNIASSLGGYSTYSIRQKDVKTTTLNTYYTLLPVWMITEDYENKEFMFAMNGQTGKVVGKPPLSKSKVASWLIGVTIATFIILRLLVVLTGGTFL